MGLEYKEVKCPNCGAPIKLKSALRSKVVICEYCNAEISLEGDIGIKVGERTRHEYPTRLAVKLGQIASFEGKRFELVGRIVYEFDDDEDIDYWEEFLFLADDGEYIWLECDCDGFTKYREFRPKRPINPRTLSPGQSIELDDKTGTVKEIGPAKIAFFEGELTWKVKLDSSVMYVDIEFSTGETGSIEYTDKELEFFIGRSISRKTVYEALGIKYTPPKKDTKSGIMFVVIVIIIIVLCCLFSKFGGGTSSSSGIRTSSPSNSFSSSGGK